MVASLGLESALSVTVKSVDEALAFKKIAGLPLILRPSYTLGGMGGSVVRTEEEFIPFMERGYRGESHERGSGGGVAHRLEGT